jgi:hypothetical protein
VTARVIVKESTEPPEELTCGFPNRTVGIRWAYEVVHGYTALLDLHGSGTWVQFFKIIKSTDLRLNLVVGYLQRNLSGQRASKYVANRNIVEKELPSA